MIIKSLNDLLLIAFSTDLLLCYWLSVQVRSVQ